MRQFKFVVLFICCFYIILNLKVLYNYYNNNNIIILIANVCDKIIWINMYTQTKHLI